MVITGQPSDKSLGYFQTSLRDKNQRVRPAYIVRRDLQ
jgi:hypothetical protein